MLLRENHDFYQRFSEVYRRFPIYRLASPKQKTLPRKEEFALKSINQADHVAALDAVFKNRFRIVARKEITVK